VIVLSIIFMSLQQCSWLYIDYRLVIFSSFASLQYVAFVANKAIIIIYSGKGIEKTKTPSFCSDFDHQLYTTSVYY